MRRITVYADFDFLDSPQVIGVLGYEQVRGNDHFVFEYSREWLKQHGGIILSGDLMNIPALQHPRGKDCVFGFVKDSFPDRWGRLLLDRRERIIAQSEGRQKKTLTNYDYLIGIEGKIWRTQNSLNISHIGWQRRPASTLLRHVP